MDKTVNGPAGPKLLARLRASLRRHQLSPRTMQAYVSWVRRFVYFHNVRHPADMADPGPGLFDVSGG